MSVNSVLGKRKAATPADFSPTFQDLFHLDPIQPVSTVPPPFGNVGLITPLRFRELHIYPRTVLQTSPPNCFPAAPLYTTRLFPLDPTPLDALHYSKNMSFTVAPMTKLSPLNPAFARSPLSQSSSPSSPLSPTSSFSSPSSSPSSPTSGARPLAPKRGPSFPSSRPLRPFASVKTAISKPTVKIIQPPAGLCGPQFFVLNMTQGELARQD